MKTRTLILIVIIAVIGAAVGVTQATKVKPSKSFEVTFSVRYNSITLEEAARKEADFRARYTDACLVDVTVKEAQDAGVSVSYGNISFIADSTWQARIIQEH